MSYQTLPEDGDLALVRAVLARELETINEYEAFAQRASDPTIRAFFLHLAKEEKEHVSEAMHLIHHLDGDQEKQWQKADVRPEHFMGAGHGAHATSEASPTPAPDASRPAPRAPHLIPRFTVGSLKGA